MLIVKNLIGDVLLKILSIIKLIFITPLFVSFLGVKDYGVYIYIISTAEILGMIFALGTGEFLQIYYNNSTNSERKEYIGNYYLVNLVMFSLITLLLIFFSEYFGSDFIGIGEEYIVALTLIGILSCFPNIFLTIAHYQREIKKVYILSTVSFIITLLVIIYSIYFEKEFSDFISLVLVGRFLYLIICIVVLRKISFSFTIGISRLRKMLSISIFFMFSTIFFYAMTYVDKFLIKKYMTDYDLGIYSLASNVAVLLAGVLSSVLFPVVKTKINENIQSNDKLIEIEKFGMNSVNVFFLPELMGLAVYGYNFILFYAGNDFSDSYYYFVILLINVYINLISYFYIQRYLLKNKKRAVKSMFLINIVSLLVNGVLNIITIPEYGLLGAAVSSVITYSCQFIFVLIITKSLSLFYRILRYLVVSLMVWGTGYTLWNDSFGFWLMWVYCVISMIIYWVFLYALNKKDIKDFYKTVRAIND